MTVDLDALVEERLAALSLTEKVGVLTGADAWSLRALPSAGLRRLVMSDGPAGVRGETWDERDASASIPCPTALAATWDPQRVQRTGSLLAAEARRKGVDVLLAPTVNLHRTPFGGRHFECFSEDPLLTAVVGAAFVRGVQDGGVAATVKHFVANDSETDRFTYDAQIDERTLRELYLRPFEVAVRDAGAWVVMAAYNGVNGVTLTESPLIRDVLKGEWEFDGVVVSDWGAARSVRAAADGLLDVVMPGPAGPWGDALTAAVRAGDVSERAVDDKVRRILRLAARTGALEGAAGGRPAGRPWPQPEVAAALRETAAAGFVLLHNSAGVLPLDAGALRRVAVVGPSCAAARVLGGGSATVFPPYVVAPLEGLRSALGDTVDVVHAAGCRLGDRVPLAPIDLLTVPDTQAPGIEVRYFGADGHLHKTEHRHGTHLIWSGSVGDGVGLDEVGRIEVRTRLRAPAAGTYLVGGAGLGTMRLSIDGRSVAHADLDLPPSADVVEGIMRPPQVTAPVALAAGDEVDVTLDHRPGAAARTFGEEGPSTLALQVNVGPLGDEDHDVAAAVASAADADVAIVVVGTSEEVESEGFDRTELALPGRQDELVRRVAAVNPRTVVVVNAGAPVLLPWADDVAAVLLVWFPGQEFGNALADVLLGIAEPGGRLPTTWFADGSGHPSVTPVDGRLAYREGLFVGHRGHGRDRRRVRYPFGHGLGYTEWTYEAVAAPEAAVAGDDVEVRVRVRNTGPRRGREVVQAYASRPDGAVPRPGRWLVGFAALEAQPGEAVEVTIRIAARDLQHWDEAQGWTVEPGRFVLEVSRSVTDVRQTVDILIDTPSRRPSDARPFT